MHPFGPLVPLLIQQHVFTLTHVLNMMLHIDRVGDVIHVVEGASEGAHSGFSNGFAAPQSTGIRPHEGGLFQAPHQVFPLQDTSLSSIVCLRFWAEQACGGCTEGHRKLDPSPNARYLPQVRALDQDVATDAQLLQALNQCRQDLDRALAAGAQKDQVCRFHAPILLRCTVRLKQGECRHKGV